jgi:radical SAM superfamily enzyme YgiQ (UPF0313 family)
MKITLAAIHQVSKLEPIPLYGGIGVLALAATVKQRNYDCEVIDLVRFGKITGQFETVTSEIVDKLLKTKPEIIGFSTCTDSLIIALELGKKIKERSPHICIVFGGPGVSYCSQEVIKNFSAVDYIIRGEADYAFPDFISAYEAKEENPQIKGLVYRYGDTIVDSGWPDPVDDLNQLPIPAYEFYRDDGFETPWFDKNFGFHIEAGRGCPYNCSFCSTSNYFKRKYRVKSVERIIEEIQYIKNKLNNRRVRFTHDLLTYNRDYMESLCNALSLKFSDIRWGCDSRLDTIDPALIEKMVKSGCDFVYLGIEAGTPEMQKKIGKRLDLSRIDMILPGFKKWNVQFIFSFVLGLPEEKMSDIAASFELALKAKSACVDNCTIQMHPLMPELGSRLFPKDINDLVYDVDHSFMDSAVPGQWTDLHKTIQERPEIFPRFFLLKSTLTRHSSIESDPSKFSYFAYILQVAMKNSLVFAYRILGGGNFPLTVVDCFDSALLTRADTIEDTDFSDLFNLIISSTVKLIGENLKEVEVFKSIATYEIAVFEVMQKKYSGFFKKIETCYSEREILNFISNHGSHEKASPKLRHFMILWDKETQHIKSLEISSEIAMLVNA